jgi:hypothetical protein
MQQLERHSNRREHRKLDRTEHQEGEPTSNRVLQRVSDAIGDTRERGRDDRGDRDHEDTDRDCHRDGPVAADPKERGDADRDEEAREVRASP